MVTKCANPFEVTSSPNCSLYKTIFTLFNALLYTCKAPWTNFNTLLYTCKIPLNKLQCLFVHLQNHHEPTSIPFCTRAKSPWTNFNAFLHTCKSSMQTFKALLFMMQNRIVWAGIIMIVVIIIPLIVDGGWLARRNTKISASKSNFDAPLII